MQREFFKISSGWENDEYKRVISKNAIKIGIVRKGITQLSLKIIFKRIISLVSF